MNLRKTIFILPNLLTASSLFCGVYAITKCIAAEVTNEDVYSSTLLLFYAFAFDLFDGKVARMTKTQSSFGVEFDSLADLISFGVAPAIIAYRWSLADAGTPGTIVAFLYVLGGAVRLARFNVLAHGASKKSKPGKYMLGLPIPVAAAFVVALIIASRAMEDGEWPWLTSQGFTINGIGYPMMSLIMAALAMLMVSNVKFRSFKDLQLKSTLFIGLVFFVVVVSSVLWLFFSAAYILIGLLLLYVTWGFIEAIVQFTRMVNPQKRQ